MGQVQFDLPGLLSLVCPMSMSQDLQGVLDGLYSCSIGFCDCVVHLDSDLKLLEDCAGHFTIVACSHRGLVWEAHGARRHRQLGEADKVGRGTPLDFTVAAWHGHAHQPESTMHIVRSFQDLHCTTLHEWSRVRQRRTDKFLLETLFEKGNRPSACRNGTAC